MGQPAHTSLPTLLGACLLGATLQAATAGTPAIDPEADALLKRMSDYLAGLRSFAAEVRILDQQMLNDGFKLTFYRQGGIEVQNPDRFHLSRTGMLRDQEAFFDGKRLVFHGRRLKAYVTVEVKGDIDTALDTAVDVFGAELPARDLFGKNAYAALMEPVTQAAYIGRVPMEGAVCHQLAFRTDEVDWQIWIRDGDQPVPCRYSITSKWITGAPQYRVAFTNWRINPQLPEATFEFTPAAGEHAVSPHELLSAVGR